MSSVDDGICHVCGKCWWVDCPNDADYAIRDVHLKHKSKPMYHGDVELCAGHYGQTVRQSGRMDLNWNAVEQAIALTKARA